MREGRPLKAAYAAFPFLEEMPRTAITFIFINIVAKLS